MKLNTVPQAPHCQKCLDHIQSLNKDYQYVNKRRNSHEKLYENAFDDETKSSMFGFQRWTLDLLQRPVMKTHFNARSMSEYCIFTEKKSHVRPVHRCTDLSCCWQLAEIIRKSVQKNFSYDIRQTQNTVCVVISYVWKYIYIMI